MLCLVGVVHLVCRSDVVIFYFGSQFFGLCFRTCPVFLFFSSKRFYYDHMTSQPLRICYLFIPVVFQVLIVLNLLGRPKFEMSVFCYFCAPNGSIFHVYVFSGFFMNCLLAWYRNNAFKSS